MICNVCGGTGFKNLHQIPESEIGDGSIEHVQKWIASQTEPHDVCVCDCCGDGDIWYGEPGQHYGHDDPQGMRGPYAYNGGLCKCH
jgi:hypothetical protein